MTNAAEIATAKAAERRRFLARRAARPNFQRRRAATALAYQARRARARVIAGFVPHGGEPGSIEVLEELRQRATILLPITGAVGEPLRWAAYGGVDTLVKGPYGILQPPAPDEHVLADAEMIFVPAVAVGRDGSRLGHGNGFYDRSLVGIPPEKLCAVVHDDEVADTLPMADHDIRVGWILTPTSMTRALT